MLKTIIVALLLCLAEFLTIIIISPLGNPKLLLSFLPEDIREAGKDHPAPAAWKQAIAFLLLILMLAGFVYGIIYLGKDGIREGYGLWRLTGRFLLALYIIKIFDIVVQDQWLVMSTDFFKKIFPETKDCAGWNDRHFNDKNQIIRLIIFPFCALLTAWIFIKLN